MNKLIKLALFVLIMAFGVFLFIYGGYDDSPGAQGLGALVFIAGILGIIKSQKNKKSM